MLKPVVAVKDKKIGMFDSPFVVRHNGEAMREFDTVRQDKNTKFGKNPEDFDLYQIGTYDETTGELVTLSPPTHLISGV